MDKEKGWDFFDGASQKNFSKGGQGGIIYVNNSKYYKFAVGLRCATNNRAELMGLGYTLLLAHNIGIRDIQIIIDLVLVIDWMKKAKRQTYIHLDAIVENLFILSTLFSSISYQHIYKERRTWK